MPNKTFPHVAVLLAAYNGLKWIKEQIDSILKQNHVSVVIFISIDISIDETRKYLEELYCIENRIVILDDVERFGGAAKNFFRLIRDVDFSEFDYVAFADQDDIWFLDKLLCATQMLVNTSSYGYSSNVLAFWEDGNEKLIIKSQKQCKYDYLFEAAGPGCTYVMRRLLALQIKENIVANWQAINRVGLHDWYCYAYARANGFKWVIDENPSMMYRQHAHNQVGVNRGWKAFEYRCKKVFTGWGISQSALIAKLIGMGNSKFVTMWSGSNCLGFVGLALYANQCRRKNKEKILFFFACIIMATIRIKIGGKK